MSFTVRHNQIQNHSHSHGALNPARSDHGEGWAEEGDGSRVQEGGDTCIPVADSY